MLATSLLLTAVSVAALLFAPTVEEFESGAERLSGEGVEKLALADFLFSVAGAGLRRNVEDLFAFLVCLSCFVCLSCLLCLAC